MRKEDKVKGKKKTPLYLDRTHKTVDRSPEGRWERKDITIKRPNPEAQMGRFRQGMDHRPEFSATGGAGYGYKRQPHGTGGELRGVKKKDQPAEYQGRTPAQKVADKRKKAAYAGYDYKKGFNR
jgi:hypothetical protein